MKTVTIYSTPTCPHCRAAKKFFDDYHVEYQDIDVTVDNKAAQEMIKKSGQMGVPVIQIDDTLVIGFDEPRLKELLKL